MTTDTEEDIPPIYKYGPWKEIKIMYDKNDTKIIEVAKIIQKCFKDFSYVKAGAKFFLVNGNNSKQVWPVV